MDLAVKWYCVANTEEAHNAIKKGQQNFEAANSAKCYKVISISCAG